MKNKNLIFIPVYNNEKQIKNVLEDLKKLSLSKIILFSCKIKFICAQIISIKTFDCSLIQNI